MNSVDHIFEKWMGVPYNTWFETEFNKIERKFYKAYRIYKPFPEFEKKWKRAEARYKQALFILETYERYELALSGKSF